MRGVATLASLATTAMYETRPLEPGCLDDICHEGLLGVAFYHIAMLLLHKPGSNVVLRRDKRLFLQFAWPSVVVVTVSGIRTAGT